MYCDHQQFRDLLTGEIFQSCFCFCPSCYSTESFVEDGNGCVCTDCFCRTEYTKYYCRSTTVVDEESATALRIRQKGQEKVENLLADLPEKPGKTGTCRECKAPTYRNGNRGRFPSLCTDCKNN